MESDSRVAALVEELGGGKELSDAIYALRESMESWQNRLSLKNLALAKRYLKGELVLHIHCKVESPRCGSRDAVEYCAVFNGAEAVKGELKDLGSPHEGQDQIAGAEEHAKGCGQHKLAGQALNVASHKAERVMFVGIVELPDNPVRIADVKCVGDAQEIHSLLAPAPFLSVKSGFRLLGSFKDGEVIAPSASRPIERTLPEVVERDIQIVNCVGGYCPPPMGDVLSTPNNNCESVVGVRVSFFDNSVRFSTFESGDFSFEITDVLFGPFEFDLTAGGPVAHD